MKLLSTYLRGKSLTVCFAFPEDYDMANIDDLNVSIGSKQFTGDDIDISGQVACVRLKSEDTYKLTGDYPIIISIDDETRGVIPIYVGDIRFATHRNSLNNASTNEETDIVIALSITQTTINVDSVLYDVMAGKAATIEVGTVTTLEAGEDATIENTGTENEAVFNFGIPKGDKGDKGDAGDMFSGQFNTVILKQNCVWVDGWLWIDTGSKVASKIIEVGYMAISTGIATEYLKPLVHYPAAIINTNTSNPTGFYIKDIDGRLSENTDFEFVDIKYNIKNDTVAKYDGLTTLKKGGFVLEETAGNEYHSRYGIYSFNAVYPEYTGVKIESISDPLIMGEINQPYTPTYCRKRNVNLISKPYQNASVSENFGSNPDIFTVASHYGNTFERRDITANATTFLQNVIAIGSCGDGEPDTDTWTSHGNGLEFSERGNNLGLNADYPTETFPHAIGYGTGAANTFTDSVGTRNYENMLQVEIGAKVKIGLTYETAVEYTIAGLSGNTFTTVETLSLPAGTNYVYIDALIGTAWQTAADNQKYVQSPVCSIVAAKFRKIQDVTGASWDTIRLACRATASNGGTWDMYRGFGVIDVDAAIDYIKANYTENEDYLNSLADEVDRTRGIDPMLPYEKLTNDTPVPKKYVPAIFWDEDNNTYSFTVPDGGMIQIGQEPHDYYTNLQGTQIVNGDIVSIIGATENRTAIALTDATNDAKALSCFGMVTVATIGNNNVGRITKSGGKVRGLNTAGYLEGATIYVDPSNPGKWTATKPAAPLRAIQIGVVSVSHAVEGVVELFIKVYPKFGELADVDGATTEVLDTETMPVKKADGLIKFLSWANIKATLKAYFDTLYGSKTILFSDTTYNASYLSGVWSADSTTDVLTSTVEHGLTAGIAISFSNLTGALPAGISADPEYYWVESVVSDYAIKIKSTFNGAAIDITDDGIVGWGVRKFSTAPAVAINFSNNSEIEILSTDFSLPQAVNGNAYFNLTIAPVSARIFLNDVNVYGATRTALLYSQMMNKKYIKSTLKIKIRKLFNYNYFIEISINGIYSDVITLASSSVALTRVFTGYITSDSEITSIYIANGYTDTIKNGTRVQVIKKQ